MNDAVMLGGWRFRSKHELAVRVERYAASIGKPVDEVLLSLLFSALDDLDDISGEYNALKGALEDFPAWVAFMLSARRMKRKELCEKAGISQPTLGSDLEAENAKLRELVADLWEYIHIGTAQDGQSLHDRTRELGVEV